MNRLDEVLLLSSVDPEFVVSASEAENTEIQQIITLLDKSKDLWLIPSSKSELLRIGDVLLFKANISPHYLIILLSSDRKAMLETRSLIEIDETVRLLSSQLESMLKTPS
jgi:hypothetical protein